MQSAVRKATTIAVVGLSNNKERLSDQATKVTQNAAYKIIPVNLKVNDVLSEKVVAKLTAIKEHGDVDIINTFHRSEFLQEMAKEFMQIDGTLFLLNLVS